jgi:xanthine dehydrogenase molybdenum-binding subunit
MAEGAPLVGTKAGNILSESAYQRGDVEAAIAASAHVVSDSFRTASIEHAYLEPESSLAVPQTGEGPRMLVLSQGQGAWEDRRQIASLLGWEPRDVLVTQVATGGAFGGKEDLNVQGHAALLALAADRPVLLALSRADSLRFSIKRHRFWMEYTVACDAEGHLTAVKARFIGDNGGYASVGAKVLERAAGHACSAYIVPNVDVRANAVLTNNPPCGAMRGFGANQANFAMETLLDRLAEAVGIDGWEIRWRNALAEGDRFGTGQKLGPGVGLKETLLAVKDQYRSARYAGIACGAKNTGIGNGMKEYGRAVLRPEGDGRLTVFHSWTEMGQGTHTVMRQIAGDELDLRPEAISVVVDTSHELDTGITTASRATMLGGRAVLQACQALRAEMTRRRCRLDDLAGEEFPAEVLVDWTTPLGADVEEPVTHFGYGWATQVCILDDEGRIEKFIAAHDVGKALDPLMLEGQVVGGVHMGLGHSLSEAFETEGGFPVTDTIKSLNIIPASGMPPVETILVEEFQPEGPYGAKGMGEAVLVPTAAAVAGALYAFDGIRRTELPMRDSSAAVAAVPKLRRRKAG